MRTTLVLDDQVYETARKLAFDQRRSLGEIISELAAKGLRSAESESPKRPLGFWEGQGRMADDFNDTPTEVLESLGADV
jgi:hypothetical protein